MTLRHGASRYEIKVENPTGMSRGIAFASLDEIAVAERPLRVRTVDDGATHHLLVKLG